MVIANAFILQATDLDSLIQALRNENFEVMGPTIRDQAIVYEVISKASDLPQGWTDEQEKGTYRLTKRDDNAYFGYAVGPHSWKKFLQLPRRKIWDAEKSKEGLSFREAHDPARPIAFLGVRSCELHAIDIQDQVFSQGQYVNQSYKDRRNNVFIVAINCAAPAKTCFCTAMKTGPRVTLDNDLSMTEVIGPNEHFFFVQSGSSKGERILQQLPLQAATESDQRKEAMVVQATANQVQSGPRAIESSDLKDLLYRNYENPEWEDVAKRCLSCANCTMACPTCFCSTVEDVTDLKGDHAERWERWDSCFTGDFSHVHGGSIRQNTRSRYRQWMTHKLATWADQFGTSGCVGCGRCIAWCPVGIDITEEVLAIRKKEKCDG